ncbi:MAG: PQQ-dependent sugar dehydrogenase, partial [Janthinobacterium lividum]
MNKPHRVLPAFTVLAAAVTTCLSLSGSVFAQAAPAPAQSIDKLKQMRVSGTDPNIPTVVQTGANADAIRANLKRIKLPPGFKIDLYAVVPDARHMAVAPSTNMLFVGTRKSTVWAVTDRNSSGTATEVKQFAPSLKMAVPNGVCWTRDGVLVVVEQNRVLSFPAAEFFYEGADVAVGELVPQGKLIPVEDESFNHGARVCRVGADNKLYIALGQPFNVPPRANLPRYAEWGIGGIVRMDVADGAKREVYARGIRNSVGIDFNPGNGQLWFTDNQTDGMGDDTPPGEVNRITKAGQNFGYPWLVGKVRIKEEGYDKDALPANLTGPEVEMAAHAADLGMVFYRGDKFPAKYRGGFFTAEHGSWNRSKPIGARIMFTSLKSDGSADKTEVFADGWLDPETQQYRG